LYLAYVLHWPDDGCFTAETRYPDVTESSVYLVPSFYCPLHSAQPTSISIVSDEVTFTTYVSETDIILPAIIRL